MLKHNNYLNCDGKKLDRNQLCESCELLGEFPTKILGKLKLIDSIQLANWSCSWEIPSQMNDGNLTHTHTHEKSSYFKVEVWYR
jgi:hypothetical protein